MRTTCSTVLCFALTLAACGGTDDDPCEGIDCSLHGTCEAVSGQPTCRCDDGFINRGLVCHPDWCAVLDCGRGTCHQDPDAGWCDCDPGWAGDACDRCAAGYHPEGEDCVQDSGPCHPNPCTDAHRTTCIPEGGGHSCACDPGYQDNDLNDTCLPDCQTAADQGLLGCDVSACDDSSGQALCQVCDHDGTCDPGEDNDNCPDDCPVCDDDGTCDPGETHDNCPGDCPPDLAGTPVVDGSITVGAGDWSEIQRVGESRTPSDWDPNHMTDLFVAYDETNLYVGVRGFVEAQNALAVYIDVEYGAGDGLASIASTTDNDGALDNALSADILIAEPDLRADVAVGTKGMASASGMDAEAGWRGITGPPDNFAWLSGELQAGADAFEASIPWQTINGGLPEPGRVVGLFARLTNEDGQFLANQTLPQDDPDQPKTVSVAATFVVGTPTTTCDHDGDCEPGESTLTCPDDCPPCGDPDAFAWEDAVMYFVMIDRFFDGDPLNNADVPGVPDEAAQYQGGDFAGVEAKLDYLQGLGVNTIWLSAPFENRDLAGAAIDPGADPHMYSGYHGYWPSPEDIDYTDPFDPSPVPAVESRLGTGAELQSLIDAAHARGIYVLFDYVMNHVDLDSGLYQAHPDWFAEDFGSFRLCHPDMWNDPHWGTRCAFTDYLPPFDFYQPDVRAWSVADAVWWAWYYDVDGYRLDAIKHVPLTWLTELRTALDASFPSPAGGRFYLVGETFEYEDRGKIKAFIDPDSMLDGQFDFPLKKQLCDAVFSRNTDLAWLFSWMDGNDGFYSPDTVMTTWIGNHDIPRTIHFASGQIMNCTQGSSPTVDWGWNPQNFLQPADAAPYERLGLAYGILMTSRGIPLIYYGDEIGLAGGGDPDNRRMMTFDGLNPHQEALRALIGKLARIRAENVSLRRGRRETVTPGSDTYVYRMTGCGGGEDIYILVNRGDAPASLTGLPAGEYDELISETSLTGGAAVDVPARSLLIARPR